MPNRKSILNNFKDYSAISVSDNIKAIYSNLLHKHNKTAEFNEIIIISSKVIITYLLLCT